MHKRLEESQLYLITSQLASLISVYAVTELRYVNSRTFSVG